MAGLQMETLGVVNSVCTCVCVCVHIFLLTSEQAASLSLGRKSHATFY